MLEARKRIGDEDILDARRACVGDGGVEHPFDFTRIGVCPFYGDATGDDCDLMLQRGEIGLGCHKHEPSGAHQSARDKETQAAHDRSIQTENCDGSREIKEDEPARGDLCFSWQKPDRRDGNKNKIPREEEPPWRSALVKETFNVISIAEQKHHAINRRCYAADAEVRLQ